MNKASRRKLTKPHSQVILSPVMRFDNLGQLTVPNHLKLGNNGKLYLTRDSESDHENAEPQPINLKESVAWFRLGHDCNLNIVKGEYFNDWLKLIEQSLS